MIMEKVCYYSQPTTPVINHTEQRVKIVSPSLRLFTPNMRHGAIQQMRVLQDEVSCLNELGCRRYETGQLQEATSHFYHALASIKKIAQLKEGLQEQKDHDNHRHEVVMDLSLAMRADERRRGSHMLPVDSDSDAGRCVHWGTISSVALMHNAAMVHCKSKAYARATNMLDLARGVLEANGSTKAPHLHFSSCSLPRLMKHNRYAVSVVAKLYISIGHVLSKMTSTLKHKRCQLSHCQAKAKEAYTLASSLLQSFQEKELQAIFSQQQAIFSLSMLRNATMPPVRAHDLLAHINIHNNLSVRGKRNYSDRVHVLPQQIKHPHELDLLSLMSRQEDEEEKPKPRTSIQKQQTPTQKQKTQPENSKSSWLDLLQVSSDT
jgi:hypothetical protein